MRRAKLYMATRVAVAAAHLLTLALVQGCAKVCWDGVNARTCPQTSAQVSGAPGPKGGSAVAAPLAESKSQGPACPPSDQELSLLAVLGPQVTEPEYSPRIPREGPYAGCK